MKISKGLTTVGLCAVLIACAPVPAARTANAVPKELIPAGFEAKDCHLVPMAQQDSGGVSSVAGAGGGSDAIDSADNRDGGRGQVECHHTTELLPASTRCFDDNGQEHPVQWCKDRQAERDATRTAKPTG